MEDWSEIWRTSKVLPRGDKFRWRQARKCQKHSLELLLTESFQFSTISSATLFAAAMQRFRFGEHVKSLYRAMANPRKVPVFVISLDALGTVYRVKEAVSAQYLRIAEQSGIRTKIDPLQLNKSFMSAFKHYNTVYPLYGKGQLKDPEVWWAKLVDRAFRDVVDEEIPPDLGANMYRHFSSGDAYELFPDVHPFLESIRALKNQFTDPDGPLLVTGIVTNSDPRVKLVLEGLGLTVGPSRPPELKVGEEFSKAWAGITSRTFKSTPGGVLDVYNFGNDLDFLCTSYESDHEKPDPAIWTEASHLLTALPMSRAEQAYTPRTGMNLEDLQRAALESLRHQVGEVMWIHIGDEHAKDYVGATAAGLNGLLVARKGHDLEGVEAVSSLEEAAMVASVMAQGFFDGAASE